MHFQILNNNLDGGNIIDKGYFPTQQTYIRNNIFILEKSASILLKNIKSWFKIKKLYNFFKFRRKNEF